MQNLLNQIEYQCQGAPDEAMFKLWRAVLSLAHVDNEVDDLEDYLSQSITQIFKFSDEQKAQLEKDRGAKRSPRDLFMEIEGTDYRAQFFRLARIVIWCDGILHEDEMAIVHDIQEALGDEAGVYEADLRWMNRKPDLPFGESASIPEEAMIKSLIYQMIAFYEELEAQE